MGKETAIHMHVTLPEDGRDEDLDYMSDAAAAVLLRAPRGGRLILWATFAFFVAALAWAYWAQLDEVTAGIGKVIPSSQVQVVQNLEGGIVSEILVHDGDHVEKGQVLLRIDDTRFASSLREAGQKYNALLLRKARLYAEANASDMVVPEGLGEEVPDMVRDERKLYTARADQLANNRKILQAQVRQREQELDEAKAKQKHLGRSLELLSKELKMTEPLVDAGAISKVDVLRLRRQVNDQQGELDAVKLSIPRLQSQLVEVRKKADEVGLSFRAKAREELSDVVSELSQMQESNVALRDRVKRTSVRSPMRGTVKQVLVSTVGGVIQPGMDLVEIVPSDDSLLVEAKVSPRDIGFIGPGQEAVVKITAYDFSIYGGLKGKVEQISADAIQDDEGRSFYLVRVRTEENHLGTSARPLPIIPGMQAEVDILTGKKSVLQYLLKPVLKARQQALRER
jgi:adhesin transport system membrane fusion protein